MADVVYVALAYWPYLAGAFAIGILVGWWSERARHGDLDTWLEHEREER